MSACAIINLVIRPKSVTAIINLLMIQLQRFVLGQVGEICVQRWSFLPRCVRACLLVFSGFRCQKVIELLFIKHLTKRAQTLAKRVRRATNMDLKGC